ncbi:hypothetical protein RGL56_000483 [Vibrio parahaemolyticus]|nr:hypothetical protein [Vibrio parahaemolyticus]ELA8147927.1 hypothetical protein [Vibrio parahaemolyticus]HCG5245892.1 hypothetical protein [Vibrio parahaemolyticus]HCM1608267.1 hypothetical protein [Vibrio parahaemolyticus]
MAFVINSDEWDFNGLDVVSVSLKLEQILERIYVARERSEPIYVGNDLQSRNVSEDKDLWTFLYDTSMEEMDRGIIDELSAFLAQAEYYESNDSTWPPGFPTTEVTDANSNILGLDLTFAHLHIKSHSPYACLTVTKQSEIKSYSTLGMAKINMIHDEDGHIDFWRNSALAITRDTAQNLEKLSSSMYPNLYFSENVWRGINDFDGGYARTSRQLQKYLSALDDYGAWIFTEPPPAEHPTDTVQSNSNESPSNELIEKRFASVGLTMAPEKPDVRQDGKCYRARLIDFHSGSIDDKPLKLYCEWHGKLELHINRIHIHPPIDESGNRVIIAIYHRHLPLPHDKNKK